MKKIMKSLLFLFIGVLVLQCKQSETTGNTTVQVHSFPEIEKVSQYLTAKDTEFKLTEINDLKVEEYDQPDEHYPTVIIDPRKTFQEIVGFGGALTDASAETFYKLPEEKQDEILEAYFDQEKGLGYTFCRTHINSCDFSSESYAYTEVEDDVDLRHFTIEQDRKYRIPFIKAALSAADNNMELFASPWSPPAWMKTTNNMLQGGKLKEEYYQAWGDYFVKFFEEYEKEGIEFWGMTVQNEPMATQTWESCLYTAEEERDFVKNNLGPALEKSKYKDHNIVIYDHNRGVLFQRASTVYDDPEASKYVWGAGFHWYSGDHFENVKHVKEAYPDKGLLFTEGCVFPFNMDNVNEWHWGERYGESIIHDLNNGTNGWVDWNILLDETGGPNHVSNFCFAPVIGDTRSGEVHYMNSYYYMGHFSKFIRPGAKRIVCSSNHDDILATAFINTDQSIVLVAMNSSEENKRFSVWMNHKGIPMDLPAHSISTLVIN